MYITTPLRISVVMVLFLWFLVLSHSAAKTGGLLVFTGRVCWVFFPPFFLFLYFFKSVEQQVCFSLEVLSSNFIRASEGFFTWYQIPCFTHDLPFSSSPLLDSGYCTFSLSLHKVGSWMEKGHGCFSDFINSYHFITLSEKCPIIVLLSVFQNLARCISEVGWFRVCFIYTVSLWRISDVG